MTEAVIVSATRTAIGNYGESLKDVHVTKLGAIAIRGAFEKIGLRPLVSEEQENITPVKLQGAGLTDLEQKYAVWDKEFKPVAVDEVIMGHVVQAGQGQNTARQATIFAGLPKETPAYTVNKLCGSGLKTIALAAEAIRNDDAEVIVAGGMENMSSIPYIFPKGRWGARMFHAEMLDGLIIDGLGETFYNYHMGNTAENIAAKYGISREEQDKLSVESNDRAIAAIKAGVFKNEIIPVEVKQKRNIIQFDTDEHPRASTLESLVKLPSVFKKDGTVTAGNASGITDAGAAVIVMSDKKAKELGLEPMATIRSYSPGALDPAYMGLGVVPAVKKALKKAGLKLGDIKVNEINEAFAAQVLGVASELDIDFSITNKYGSGISLGHPIGCTGTRIMVTLLHEMKRDNLNLGMAALCIGGGQGMAMIVDR